MGRDKPTGCAFALFLAALAVLVLLFIGVFVIYGGLGATLFNNAGKDKEAALKQMQKFDPVIWNSEYLDSYKSVRKPMVNNLATEFLKEGLSHDSLIIICGEADSLANDTIYYKAGYHIDEERKTQEYLKVVIHNRTVTSVHMHK